MDMLKILMSANFFNQASNTVEGMMIHSHRVELTLIPYVMAPSLQQQMRHTTGKQFFVCIRKNTSQIITTSLEHHLTY